MEEGERKQLSEQAMCAWTCKKILEESKVSGALLLCMSSLALT